MWKYSIKWISKQKVVRRGEERTRQKRTGQDRRQQNKGQGSRPLLQDRVRARGRHRNKEWGNKEHPLKDLKRIFTPKVSLQDLIWLLISNKQALLLLTHVHNLRGCSIAHRFCVSFMFIEIWNFPLLNCARKLYTLLRSGYWWSVLAQGIFGCFKYRCFVCSFQSDNTSLSW